MESPAAKTVTREALFEMVWKEPATKLATLYNIPYSDFKKICDSMGIPLPGSGYWSKLRAGKPVPEAIFSAKYSGPKEVLIEPRLKAESLNKPLLDNLNKFEQESEIKIPTRLTNPDPLIVAAKEQLERKNAYLNDGLVYTGSDNISIRVSPPSVQRALRFMDAFIKIVKARGYSIKVNYHQTKVIIEQEEFKVRLREKLNRTIVKHTHWDNAVYKPDGILIFVLDDHPRREWKDGKRMLEEFMPEIISRLEEKAKVQKDWRIKSEIAAAERREKERIQYELEQSQEKELTRFKGLLQDAKRWKEVKILREFISDMKSESSIKITNPEDHEAWIKWAEEKANWYDPQVNAKDELLNAVDKETLILRKKSSYYGW